MLFITSALPSVLKRVEYEGSFDKGSVRFKGYKPVCTESRYKVLLHNVCLNIPKTCKKCWKLSLRQCPRSASFFLIVIQYLPPTPFHGWKYCYTQWLHYVCCIGWQHYKIYVVLSSQLHHIWVKNGSRDYPQVVF